MDRDRGEGRELTESFNLSSGLQARIDDVIGVAGLVIVGSVLATRMYRWVRTEEHHRGDLVRLKLRQFKEATNAGVDAWHKAADHDGNGKPTKEVGDEQHTVVTAQ